MKITSPLTEEVARSLKAGDKVELSGIIVTARDAAHKHLVENRPENVPLKLDGGAIYHCGPVVRDEKVVAAGPTTSIREEAYEADVIKKYGVRAVIGKGGMGEKTLKALCDFGAVYLSAVGGAAQVIAKSVEEIVGVHMLEEFGEPEAFWVLRVKNLPLIVSMDSHGRSLYKDVEESSGRKLGEILGVKA
ncbi:MAG TPA: fumarate hydrolyase [Candidatus Altiarchaeales archaeon]|nr:fumarate hydrolyase [Candidatus Altiarchaeales archaeon]